MRIVYNDYKSNFKEFHERNIQYLATEVYKVKNGLFSVIMNNVFQFGKNFAYELRSGNHLQRTNIQTVHFGSESINPIQHGLFRGCSRMGGSQEGPPL